MVPPLHFASSGKCFETNLNWPVLVHFSMRPRVGAIRLPAGRALIVVELDHQHLDAVVRYRDVDLRLHVPPLLEIGLLLVSERRQIPPASGLRLLRVCSLARLSLIVTPPTANRTARISAAGLDAIVIFMNPWIPVSVVPRVSHTVKVRPARALLDLAAMRRRPGLRHIPGERRLVVENHAIGIRPETPEPRDARTDGIGGDLIRRHGDLVRTALSGRSSSGSVAAIRMK